MPTSPARLCSHPGCSILGKHNHRSATDERRGGSTKRGYGYRWQKRRKFALHNPDNAICVIHWEELGQVVSATERDHIVAKAKGGTDEESNIQHLCKSCNAAKGDRDDAEFRQSMRRLAKFRAQINRLYENL